MILVRDAGDQEHYRYTVVVETPLQSVYYSFPKDPGANYKYLGSSQDKRHNLEIYGEEIGLENLPKHWQEVVMEIENDAKELARQEGVLDNN